MSFYKSDKLEITFSSAPRVCERHKLTSLTKQELLSVKKYPFICKTNLWVRIFDSRNKRYYDITVPKGYCYKPRFIWRLLGPSACCIPAFVYDVLEERHAIKDRKFFKEVVGALLEISGVKKLGCSLLKKFL